MVDSGYPTDQALAFAKACGAAQIAAQDIYSGPPAPDPPIDQTPDYGSDNDYDDDSSTNAEPYAIFVAVTIWIGQILRLLRSPAAIVIAALLLNPFTHFFGGRDVYMESDIALMANGNAQFDSRAGPLDMIVDCGASKHCVPSVDQLDEVIDRHPRHPGVTVGSGSRMPVTAVGNMKITVPTIREVHRKKKVTIQHGKETMKLTNVLAVAGMPCRLFSCKWGYEHDGISTHLNDSQHLRLPSGSIVPFKPKTERHYVVEGALSVGSTDDDANLMHARLGHFSTSRINDATDHAGVHRHTLGNCEACQLNAPRKPRPKVSAEPTVYTHFGQRISSDTCGSFDASPHGYTYAINFVDSWSKYSATYFLKTQDSSDVLSAARTFVGDHKHWLVQTTTPGSVDMWFTDNGTEFTSPDLDAFCTELGTRRAMSVPYVPQRNANAERLWGILLRPMRTMLAHSGGVDTIKATLWPFLMTQATLIHNSLPTRGHDPPQAPLSLLQPGPIDLGKFKVMLCDCFVSLPADQVASKLTNRRVKGVRLGWDARKRGYFVYIPELRRITTAIDIDFDEHSFTSLGEVVSPIRASNPGARPLPAPAGRPASRPPDPAPVAAPADAPAARAPPSVPHVRLVMRSGATAPADAGPPPADSAAVVYDNAVDLALLHTALEDPVAFSTASVGEVYLTSDPAAIGSIPIPRSAKEALADPIYSAKWRDAMQEEVIGKYRMNKAWKLVKAADIPAGRKMMKGKWVFKVEYNEDGSIKRFKARWVGCGYSQREGIDFNETYASTLSAASIRLFLAATAAADDELEEADVIKAFTQGDMDDVELYVEQPHEFADPTMAACLLLKPLEGTRQAAHLFAVSNAEHMHKLGFKRCKAEPNIFTKTDDVSGTIIKVGIYVDNLICSYPKTQAGISMKDAFWKDYGQRFRIELRGEPTKFMGIEITRNRKAKTLSLTQEKFISTACDKFLSSTCTKTFGTPVHSSKTHEFMSISTATSDADRAAMRNKPYMSLMGTLLWCVFTRPDVAYYVSFLCQFMHDPSPDSYEAGLGVLAYLHSTRKLGLTFDGTKPHISVFSDSSWGQVPFPFGGHVVFYCGAAVAYVARKLKIAPQSSAEAETAVYSTSAKDLRFILNVLGPDGLKMSIMNPVAIYCDNEAAVSSIKKVGATGRTRHYDIWLTYGREQYLSRISTPWWVSTTEQIADIFTKALDKTTFLKFRAALLNMHHDAVTDHMRAMINGS